MPDLKYSAVLIANVGAIPAGAVVLLPDPDDGGNLKAILASVLLDGMLPEIADDTILANTSGSTATPAGTTLPAFLASAYPSAVTGSHVRKDRAGNWTNGHDRVFNVPVVGAGVDLGSGVAYASAFWLKTFSSPGSLWKLSVVHHSFSTGSGASLAFQFKLNEIVFSPDVNVESAGKVSSHVFSTPVSVLDGDVLSVEVSTHSGDLSLVYGLEFDIYVT